MVRFGTIQLHAKGVTPPIFFDVANLRQNPMISHFAEPPPPPEFNPVSVVMCCPANLCLFCYPDVVVVVFGRVVDA